MKLDAKVIDNVDSIENFRKVQEFLIKCGVNPAIVNACTSMEMILEYLDNYSWGYKNPLECEGDTIKYGKYVCKIVENGGLHMYLIADDSLHTTLEVDSDGMIHAGRYFSDKLSKVCDIDKNGVLLREEYTSYGESLTRGVCEDGRVPCIVNEKGGIVKSYVDHGIPNEIMLMTGHTNNLHMNMLEKYPNLREWYATRWPDGFVLDDVIQHRIDEMSGEYRLPMGNVELYDKTITRDILTELNDLATKIEQLMQQVLDVCKNPIHRTMLKGGMMRHTQDTLDMIKKKRVYDNSGALSYLRTSLKRYVKEYEKLLREMQSKYVKTSKAPQDKSTAKTKKGRKSESNTQGNPTGEGM